MLLNSHFLILESSAWHILRESVVEPSLGSTVRKVSGHVGWMEVKTTLPMPI
jgi:hypothetical protein